MTPPEEEAPAADGVSRWRARWRWFALAGACLVADLVTKWLVFYPEVLEPTFHEGMVVGEVASWWRTILVYNRGITFGLLPEAGAWVLSLGTAVVIAYLVHLLLRVGPSEKLRPFALSIVIGGAIGNLYDRTLRPVLEADKNPGVRDCLDWYVPETTDFGEWLVATVGSSHWYTSNVADVLIVCGVILLAWCILNEPEEDRDPEPGAERPAS